MRRYWKPLGVSFLSLVALAALMPAAAQAQVVYVQPSYYAPAPVVTSYYAPPVTNYYAPPVTNYYVPPVTNYYAAPAVSYYPAPTVTYASPVTYSYYPTTVYAAPAVVYPGAVTTRTYNGYGIFRPRGVYTQSYYTPYTYIR